MDQIYLFAGIYGFFGSILIVLFKIWPDVLDWRTKKKIISREIKPADREEVFKEWKFFPDSEEKTFSESKKTYNFFSTLWSFRLIGTGFMITIFYALFSSTFLGSIYNSLFVILDVFLLSVVSLYGIKSVHRRNITIKGPFVFYFIFGFNLGFYFLVLLLNYAYIDSTRLFFVDNILIFSTAISQIIFTSLFVFRYFIEKNKNFEDNQHF